MPGIWKPKTFTDADVQDAVNVIRTQKPERWEIFLKYQRLDEGFRDKAGYQLLHRELTTLLYHHYEGEKSSADLVQLMFQVRQFARNEVGLPI